MQFYINLKEEDIPRDKKDPRYSAFWANEKEKVKRGVEIDGYKFSGWLYWHLNHWKLKADDDGDGDDDSITSDIVVITPELRDNEVILNDAIVLAEEKREGLVIMGLRQMGKTSMEASYGGRAGIIYKNSQNLIMGTNADDLNNITASIDFGISNCTEYFRMPKISQDWTKERVLLGIKEKNNQNLVHSTYVIRNTNGGVKTEKGAGVSNLKCNLWDEIGKDDFLSALTATKPAMLGPKGWRTIPLATGTGGNIVKAQDAKRLFYNPSAHRFLEFENEDGSKTGLFMPGYLRQDCKYQTNLGDYLLSIGKLKSIPEDSELFLIKIKVSDKEKAIKTIKNELADFEKDGDVVNYNRWKAYYPLTIADVFLTESNNKFNKNAIKQQQEWLKNHYEPEYVDLYRGMDGKIKWRYSDYRPITVFPVKPTDNKMAPVQIYEHPVENAPPYTYCIGIDPVNHDESSDKIVSLFTVKVFKRMLSPLDQFKDEIVASYRGRPNSLADAHNIAVMMSEYYNAVDSTLPEASESSLIQHFFLKKKGSFLADAFDLNKEINNKTTFRGKKGLAPTTANQKHYMSIMVEYVNEEISEIDEEGNEILTYGASRIKDPMLLVEMLEYKSKITGKGVHDGNFDSIVSFGCALTLAKYYDAKYPISIKKATTIEDHVQKPLTIIKTPFGNISKDSYGIFNPKKVNIPSWMKGR